MSRRRSAALAGAAAVLLLASCAAPGPPGTLPDGVTMELVQLRSDLSVGRLQLRVENGSDQPVELLSARLELRAFAEDAVWRRAPATVLPGRALQLPVAIPDIDCAAEPGTPAVVGELSRDGASAPYRAEPADPLGALSRILAEACAAERAAETLDLEATALTRDGPGVAAVRVELRPTGVGRVRLVEVRPTVLLQAEHDDEGWPVDVVVDADTGPQSLTLRMEPARCDAHALADDKVGTLFPVVVEFDDGAGGRFPLPLGPGVKDALLRFVADSCGLSG